MPQSFLRLDANNNLFFKTDADGYTTTYTYNALDLVTHINYNGGKYMDYVYNAVGALVTNTWIIKKNAYGYHDVQIDAVVEGETVVDTTTNTKTKKAKKSAEEVAASEELNKSSTVVKEFVVDYNTETFEPLMEHEVNGLDYKYVYGNDRLSVDITSVTNSMSIVENGDHVRLYYHMDYLGTADYLTSPVSLKVTSWTHYNEWGEITHNAVLKCGQRELDLVKRYATHDYDNVLDLYYAKARFYDADNRRFVAVDPILDPSQYDIREYVDDPMQMVQYLYVVNNPVLFVDLLGLYYVVKDESGHGYRAIPASDVVTVTSTVGGLLPGYYSLSGPAIEFLAEVSGNVVGGNSMSSGTSIQSWVNSEIRSRSMTRAATELWGTTIGSSVDQGLGLTGAFGFWGTLSKGRTGHREDEAVFNLLEMAGIDPIGETVEDVEVMMEFALDYVRAYSWFYTDSAYVTWTKNWMGSVQYAHHDTAFQNLISLKEMQTAGKSETEIQNQVKAYWYAFICDNNKIKNQSLMTSFSMEVPAPAPYSSFVRMEVQGPFYAVVLSNYSIFLDTLASQFAEYMEDYENEFKK